MRDTTVNNAHQDKFKTHKTWPDASLDNALVNTRLLLLMTLNHVEDAKPANGQDKCQINSNLFALIDHLPFAVAEKSNQLTDTLVNHAQLDPFKILTTHKDALDHLAMVSTRSNFQLMPTAVEDVILANGQHSCQTQQETNVWKDQLLSAEHAPKDNLMMDIHALHAQLDRFNSNNHHMMLKETWLPTNSVNSTLTIQDNASNQFVVENMTFNSQWTINHVEDANHANGQDKFQIKPELLVSPDHSPSAQIALPEDQMRDIAANNAHQDKFKIHKIWLDVSLEHVEANTKLHSHTILNHVEDVSNANGQDSCLINSRSNVSQDHLPNVVAEKSTPLIDTPVRHAQQASFKIQTTPRDAWDQLAQVNTRSNLLLMSTHVVLVKIANGQDSCQTLQETNALRDH